MDSEKSHPSSHALRRYLASPGKLSVECQSSSDLPLAPSLLDRFQRLLRPVIRRRYCHPLVHATLSSLPDLELLKESQEALHRYGLQHSFSPAELGLPEQHRRQNSRDSAPSFPCILLTTLPNAPPSKASHLPSQLQHCRGRHLSICCVPCQIPCFPHRRFSLCRTLQPAVRTWQS
jgi:hypothetical protein